MDVYLEIGKKRVFAGALEWPGWNRSARAEEGALEALVAYGPRYRAAIGRKRGLVLPRSVSDVRVVELLKGDSTTDFGAVSAIPSHDDRAVGAAELRKLQAVLRASWDAFDAAADAAENVTLATGPRGGGRALEKIRLHELEGQLGYLSMLGGTYKRASKDFARERAHIREAFLEALGARARGELPDRGPKGGKRWSAGFAARRSAWHTLDHAWEIEDRARPDREPSGKFVSPG